MTAWASLLSLNCCGPLKLQRIILACPRVGLAAQGAHGPRAGNDAETTKPMPKGLNSDLQRPTSVRSAMAMQPVSLIRHRPTRTRPGWSCYLRQLLFFSSSPSLFLSPSRQWSQCKHSPKAKSTMAGYPSNHYGGPGNWGREPTSAYTTPSASVGHAPAMSERASYAGHYRDDSRELAEAQVVPELDRRYSRRSGAALLCRLPGRN